MHSSLSIIKRISTSPFGQRVKWNILGTSMGRLFGPLAQLFIVRNLEPSQFGLYALGLAWIALFDMVKDLGLSQAIIVDDHPVEKFLPLQLFIELCFASIMFCIVLVGAPILAVWFEQPGLENVLILMSLIMFISSIADPLITMHMKNQDYKILAIRQVIVPVVMGVTGLILIWLGSGVYALVIGFIAGHLAGGIVLVLADRNFLVPSWHEQHFRQLFKIGRHVFIQRISGYFSTNADSFVVGGLLGAGPLGIYRLGNQLAFLLPTVLIAPISQVVFTDVSQRREQGHAERRYYQYTYLAGMMMLSYSIVGYFTVPFLIPMVLGEQWSDTIPVAQLFCIVMTTGFMTFVNAELAKVMGFSGLYTKFTIIRSIITISAVTIAAIYSLYAVVVTWVVLGMFATIANDVLFYRAQKIITPKSGKVALTLAGWVWAIFVLLNIQFINVH